jgi:hypothetical protein
MKQLKLWLTDPECGNFCIGGAGSEAWGDLYRESELPSLRRLLLKLLKSLNLFGKLKHPQNRADLVAPSPHQNIDTVTRWIGDVLIPIWDHITSHIAQEGILIYSTSLLKHAFKSQQIRPESRAGSVEDAPTLGEKNTTKEEIEDIRIVSHQLFVSSVSQVSLRYLWIHLYLLKANPLFP